MQVPCTCKHNPATCKRHQQEACRVEDDIRNQDFDEISEDHLDKD
jgi:hypothetical protein